MGRSQGISLTALWRTLRHYYKVVKAQLQLRSQHGRDQAIAKNQPNQTEAEVNVENHCKLDTYGMEPDGVNGGSRVPRVRRESELCQELQEDLKTIKKRIEHLQKDIKSHGEIPDEIVLSDKDRARVKEVFRKPFASTEQALLAVRDAQELICRAKSNHTSCEERLRRSIDLLRKAEIQLDSAVGFKRTLVPLDIHYLSCILPEKVTKDMATLLKFIMENEVTARFAQLAFAGLPCSGKSTLFENIVGVAVSPTDQGLFIQEAVLLNLQGAEDRGWTWIPAEKEDAELLAILAAVTQLGLQMSKLDGNQCSDEGATPFESDDHLKTLLTRLQEVMNTDDREETLITLANSVLTFVNIWDVGVSKPAFELLPVLAPKVQNLVLVNLIHLTRDANPERLYNPPQLRDESLYGTRYHHCGNLLCRRSILHYFLRCVSPTCQAILLGTHDGTCSQTVVDLKEKLCQQAEQMHIEQVISQAQFLEVNITDQKDADRVKREIEDLLDDVRYKKKIPLSWIFLRCALLRQVYIRKQDLLATAMKCGLHDEAELEQWIELFQSCMSIICLSKLLSDGEYVILNPLEFFRGLHRLYFMDELCDVSNELKGDVENALYGIVSHELLSSVCEDCEDSCNLYLELLQRLGFLAQIEAPVHGYFVPSLRREHCAENEHKPESLYVKYPKEVPFDNQAALICSFQKHLPGKIEVQKEKCYNVLHCHWTRTEDEANIIDIRVRLLLSFAEVLVKTTTDLELEVARLVKLACIDAFSITRKNILAARSSCALPDEAAQSRSWNFSLAIACPNPACLEDLDAFVDIATPTCNPEELKCPQCGGAVATGDRRLWAEA